MRKLTLVLIVMLWAVSQSMARDILPYATIGFRVGWDSQCSLSFSPRFSVGVTDEDKGIFINITSGWRKFKRPIIAIRELSFIDIQAGAIAARAADYPIFFGGGVGFLFGSDREEFKLIPRTTIFSGLLLYPSIDLTFWSKSRISFDAGVEAVLPIPLGGIDIGSFGVQ